MFSWKTLAWKKFLKKDQVLSQFMFSVDLQEQILLADAC